DTPIDWLSLSSDNQKKLYPDILARVKSVKVQLADIAKKLEATGVVSHYYIEYNNDHKSIIKFADSFDIDMIIMGTKGASGLKEMFVGSLAQKIVRLSHCPVLAVEQAPADFDLDHVVLASDMSFEGLNGFTKAINLMRQLDTKVHLVFINTPVTFTDTDTLNKKWLRYREEAKDQDIEFS
ncbi:MAG: universal stress protein, partial [Bacteroidota bacterium]